MGNQKHAASVISGGISRHTIRDSEAQVVDSSGIAASAINVDSNNRGEVTEIAPESDPALQKIVGSAGCTGEGQPAPQQEQPTVTRKCIHTHQSSRTTAKGAVIDIGALVDGLGSPLVGNEIQLRTHHGYWGVQTLTFLSIDDARALAEDLIAAADKTEAASKCVAVTVPVFPKMVTCERCKGFGGWADDNSTCLECDGHGQVPERAS